MEYLQASPVFPQVLDCTGPLLSWTEQWTARKQSFIYDISHCHCFAVSLAGAVGIRCAKHNPVPAGVCWN